MVIQIIIDSLIRGSELAMLAVGLTMIYDVLRFPSIAHVEFGVVGAYIAWAISTSLPFGPIPAIVIAGVIAMIIGGGLGVLSDRLIFSRLRNASPAILMIVSFGLGVMLRYGAQVIWGSGPRSFPLPLMRAWEVAGGRLSPTSAAIIIATLIMMLMFYFLLNRTRLGIAMRATADDADLSEASGVFSERVIRMVWFIGAGFAAVGGIMLGVATEVQPNMGFALIVPVFTAAIVGGIGNVYGAVLGALIIGLAENIGLAINWAPLFQSLGLSQAEFIFIPVGYKQAIPFGLLIIVLFFRPQGLLARKTT